MTRLLASWVFPVDGPPIARGVVEIVGGVIAAVEPHRGRPDAGTIELSNVAIIPGLVNAHAHLEFSSLSSPICPPSPFTGWIGQLLSHRRERTGSLVDYVRDGAMEAAETGTSLVGDIVTADWSPDSVSSDCPMIAAFRELIGFLPEQVEPQLEIARDHIARIRRSTQSCGARCVPAISPHAPYSVCPELYHQLIDLAENENVPLCIHLAETQSELEFLMSGSGEFVEMLTRFDLWRDTAVSRGTRPIDYLRPLASLPHALIAHGNYLSESDIEFLGVHPNVATVFCPRTHEFFGHRDHPWQRLIDAGASVCIGTDGRSSSPDYSLWSELQFLARQSNSARLPQILEAGTRQGARALGLDHEAGTLAAGKRADLTLISLGNASTIDPWNALFAKSSQPVATIINGSVLRSSRSFRESCNITDELRTMLGEVSL